LRFLGGITTEVTEKTAAVLVVGNPSDFFYDINEVLANDGFAFIWEPKKEEIRQWFHNGDSLLLLGDETVEAYDWDEIALFGVTRDGSVYACHKLDMEALEAEKVEEDSSVYQGEDDFDYKLIEQGHDAIYDSEEYELFAGIVNFLEAVEESREEQLTKADDEKGGIPAHGTIYQNDFRVPMSHGFDKHVGWKGNLGWYRATGVFSVIFDITHAFCFDDNKGDYYLARGHFKANCKTFCKSQWNTNDPDDDGRRHNVHGDVLKSVSFDATPVAGKGYSVKMAKAAMPMNVAEKQEHKKTEGFSIDGSLNLGLSGEKGSAPEGKSKSSGKSGETTVSGGYEWGKETAFNTYEWYITNTSGGANSVGYSIHTSKDLESEWENSASITVKPHAYGTIDILSTWVWNVPNTKKDTDDKGIEKIHVDLKDLTTQWLCQIEYNRLSRTRETQKYSPASLDLVLGLTDRTEYGVITVLNGLADHITNVKVYNEARELVFDSKIMALASGQKYTMSLPTRYKYNIMLTTSKNEVLELTKVGGELLSVNRGEATPLDANVNFSRTYTKAFIRLTNAFAEKISYITVTEVSSTGDKIAENKLANGVDSGKSVDIPVEPGRNYIVKFSAKQGKWKSYEFSAPPSEPQYISVKNAGDVREINTRDDFDQI
ncbi:MAG: hypothetical protein KBS67_03805, partial [Bacteroidales bacterium]|nr:hypothetical protein [Candidatus Cryptobacteroides equifaecalis]